MQSLFSEKYGKITELTKLSFFDALMRRFLISTIIVIALTIVLIFWIAFDSTYTVMYRVSGTLFVTFFLSVALTLFCEKRGLSRIWLIVILPIYAIIFYFFFLGKYASYDAFASILMHAFAFIVSIFVAPYFFIKNTKKEEYSNYLMSVLWTILRAMIIGGVLTFLGVLAITVTRMLFDLNLSSAFSKMYSYWAVITVVLIAPLYFLVHFPRLDSIEKKSYTTNIFFSFLIRLVAIPFIYVYFIILYAYSVRVLTDFSNWPKGQVSILVIVFSIFGYVTYIFSRSYENEWLIGFFRRYFPYIVIPQTLMLFYAIYLRIAQYDLTMNRYIVVLFGIWLLAVSIYLIISQSKKIIVLFDSFIIMALLFSIGPWSVSNLPLARQEAKLMNALRLENMISADGVITPKQGNVLKSDDIVDTLEYLCDYDDCNTLRRLFPEAKPSSSWRTCPQVVGMDCGGSDDRNEPDNMLHGVKHYLNVTESWGWGF